MRLNVHISALDDTILLSNISSRDIVDIYDSIQAMDEKATFTIDTRSSVTISTTLTDRNRVLLCLLNDDGSGAHSDAGILSPVDMSHDEAPTMMTELLEILNLIVPEPEFMVHNFIFVVTQLVRELQRYNLSQEEQVKTIRDVTTHYMDNNPGTIDRDDMDLLLNTVTEDLTNLLSLVDARRITIKESGQCGSCLPRLCA